MKKFQELFLKRGVARYFDVLAFQAEKCQSGSGMDKKNGW
jgi:hypothetical protein